MQKLLTTPTDLLFRIFGPPYTCHSLRTAKSDNIIRNLESARARVAEYLPVCEPSETGSSERTRRVSANIKTAGAKYF